MNVLSLFSGIGLLDLGNGVVPQVVAEVGRAILAAEALTKERREA